MRDMSLVLQSVIYDGCNLGVLALHDVWVASTSNGPHVVNLVGPGIYSRSPGQYPCSDGCIAPAAPDLT